MPALEDGHRRSGGSNNDVRALTMLVQIVEPNRAPAKTLRHGLSPIVGAVGDEHRSRAAREQMARRNLRHLSRADQADLLALQRSKNLACQLYRNRGHRYR